MIEGTLTWSQNWRLGDEALWVRSFDGASRLVQRKSCIHKKYFFSLLLSFHIFCVFLVVPRTLVKSVSVENCSWLQHPQKEKKRATKRVQASRLGGENYSRSSGAIKQVCVFEDYFWMKMLIATHKIRAIETKTWEWRENLSEKYISTDIEMSCQVSKIPLPAHSAVLQKERARKWCWSRHDADDLSRGWRVSDLHGIWQFSNEKCNARFQWR